MSQSQDSSSTVKPLYLWPKGASLDAVKDAVLGADLPFKVRPFWYEPAKHHRVIVLDEGFDRIGPEYVYPKNPDNLVKAVRWFFGLEDLPVVHTALSGMRKIFGDGVNEVEDAPFEPIEGAYTGGSEWP